MEKYKICPECGAHNLPSLFECSVCEADLIGVKVVEDKPSEPDSAQENEKASLGGLNTHVPGEEPALVRICECGAENPPQARKCRVCGEDISDILPVPVEKKCRDISSYQLQSTDGLFSTVIEQPSILIGREEELKGYLCNKSYVSRQHARLTIQEGQVFIENLSRTNRTFVNNEVIPDGALYALKDGDEIGLGGKVIRGERQENAAYFVIKV